MLNDATCFKAVYIVCGYTDLRSGMDRLAAFIEEQTGGRLSLGAGTLYGALNSLQEKGWIEPYGSSEGRKKEYLITAQGKEIAEKELFRLQELVNIAVGIMQQPS